MITKTKHKTNSFLKCQKQLFDLFPEKVYTLPENIYIKREGFSEFCIVHSLN